MDSNLREIGWLFHRGEWKVQARMGVRDIEG